MDSGYWLVLCREHGLVGSGIESDLTAHRVADAHERDGCELRVLTEDQWEQLKLAGQLEPSAGSNTALEGP